MAPRPVNQAMLTVQCNGLLQGSWRLSWVSADGSRRARLRGDASGVARCAGGGPDRHCGRVDRHPGLSERVLFLLRLRWRLIVDPYEEVGWPFPDWGGPDSLGLAVQPLPPPGPLAFVCACRDAGSRARGSKLTARIREAADAAVMLWRHDPYVPTTDAMRQSEGPIQDGTRSGLGIAWSRSSRS